jgi:colanic acid/amylovoran biosynthesis glycosyltransferase
MIKGKIAYLMTDFPVCSHTFISREIKELQRMGVEIACFAVHTTPDHEIAKEDEHFKEKVFYIFPLDKWRFISVHFKTFFQKPLKYLYWFWYLISRPNTKMRDRLRCVLHFAEGIYLIDEMKRQQITHIHSHFLQGNAAVAMIISKFLNITYSVSVHNSRLPMDKILQKEKMEYAKFLISISKYNKKKMLETDPNNEKKIFVVHCGLDPDYFLPSPNPPEIFTFLAVGRLTWEKSYPDLIETCRILKEKNLIFKCVVVGEGDERQKLEQLIKQHNLEKEIKLVGLVLQENIQTYYEQAHLFVLSSVTEGIPVVLMEAMSKGLPVVATNITGIPELVLHEKTGFLVPVNQPQSFATAIEYFMNNPEIRTTMGLEGRKKVEQSFHIVKNVQQLKEIFETQLAE